MIQQQTDGYSSADLICFHLACALIEPIIVVMFVFKNNNFRVAFVVFDIFPYIFKYTITVHVF